MCESSTWWQRPIKCHKLQVIFRKRATNHRAHLRKITYANKTSYDSTPPWRHTTSERLQLSDAQSVCCEGLQLCSSPTPTAGAAALQHPLDSQCCSPRMQPSNANPVCCVGLQLSDAHSTRRAAATHNTLSGRRRAGKSVCCSVL